MLRLPREDALSEWVERGWVQRNFEPNEDLWESAVHLIMH
jgi:hypothetical protein